MQVWVFASPAADSLPALPLPGWGMGWSYGRRKKKVGEIIPTGQETGRKLIDFWLHPCSVPQRKQANEQTKAWGSHRHIICLMAGLIDSKILVFLFQKSWGGELPCCVFLISHFGICYATQLTDTNIKICKTSRLSRASKNTTLYQLKLTQERSPRVPLHINSARGFRLGGDLYRHHHHYYNTCARGLCDANTNRKQIQNQNTNTSGWRRAGVPSTSYPDRPHSGSRLRCRHRHPLLLFVL